MTEVIITAAIFGALAGAMVAVIVVHLLSVRATRQTINEAKHINGIDLFAEHHGMQRNTGESDDELIARVNRESRCEDSGL